MSKYCSYEARKIINALDNYGIEIPRDQYYNIEIEIGTYWNTHIITVIEQVLSGGNTEAKLEKIGTMGWAYFVRPVRSMLTPRAVAHRTDPIHLSDDAWQVKVYDVVTTSLLLADFNLKELQLLAQEIPTLAKDAETLSKGIEAAKRQGIRNINYLAGILRREYQTAQGRIKEIQEQTAQYGKGWEAPHGFEQMDIVERMELQSEWQDRLNSIRITQALNNAKDS